MDAAATETTQTMNSPTTTAADGVEGTTEVIKCTPAPVILARNIQKFFKNKSEQMKVKHAISTSANNKKSDLDVDMVLHDVDLILEGRSLEDGKMLLRGMVADLLKEVDVMRFRLDETNAHLKRVKEERDVVNNDYKDRLFSLMLALQNAVQDENNNYTDNTIKEQFQRGDKKLLTADEATQLTIGTLTKKIELLNVQMSVKDEQLIKAMERIDDLESDNNAKIHKINALEQQFKNINKKRNKVVTLANANAANNNNATSTTTSNKQGQENIGDKSNIITNTKNNILSPKLSVKKSSKVGRLVKLVDQMN